MTDHLARARAELISLEEKIALHEMAIATHQAEKISKEKAAEEARVFIRMFAQYDSPPPDQLAEI